MADPLVTLVTCEDYPNLEEDEAGLPDALRAVHVEPQVRSWTDPDMDWSQAGLCVVRSVRDYAERRGEFLQWAHSVPKLLNSAKSLEWSTDKHYLRDLGEMGISIIDTTWLEPDIGLTKMRVNSRIPALADFVVKPAVSSGGRDMGRYTAIDGDSRKNGILHAMELLDEGRSVMVQKYLDAVDKHGEISLIYINGILSHSVKKNAMLSPLEETGEEPQEEVVEAAFADQEAWRAGEKIRRVLHQYIHEKQGLDEQLLFGRFDLIVGDGNYHLMEISLVDANLYLSSVEGATEKFAEAIAIRAHW
ncbi:MAG: glutathione synthetase [Varibaculum sp.]|nr:glutathione synthetase [Varibaculum sp.]